MLIVCAAQGLKQRRQMPLFQQWNHHRLSTGSAHND
jgi:hypothetical protein